MSLTEEKPIHRVSGAVMTGVLALGLAACEQKPPEPVVKAKPPAEQPAPKAAATAEPAKEATDKKAAETAQAAADAALAAKVKAALGATAGLNAHRIDVVAKDGVVTLFGTADTRALRDQAAQVAAKVEDVKSVENKLAIVAGS